MWNFLNLSSKTTNSTNSHCLEHCRYPINIYGTNACSNKLIKRKLRNDAVKVLHMTSHKNDVWKS